MTVPLDMPTTAPRKKTSGRPRRLTIEQVLEAGLSIGLEQLTMGAVAEKLGVRITVLYGYVANKDELLRLVATRASLELPFPKDEGQPWQYYAMDHAETLFSLLTGQGQLISQYFAGGLGPEVEVDRVEAWLEAMVSKGFTAQQALLLYRQVGEIVVGGAVSTLHLAALRKAGVPYQDAAQRVMTMRGAEQTPLLSSVYDDFTQQAPVWRQSFLALLQHVTMQRSEVCDGDFWAALSSAH